MNKHLGLIFSDWHIHNYSNFNSGTTRLDNCIQVLTDLAEIAKSKGVKTILFAGDLYDTQKALLTEVVNSTVDAFKKFEEDYPDITIYAITGNHDQGTKNLIGKEAVSALTHISRICKNFIVVDDTYCSIPNTDAYIHGIPYYEYPEHFNQRLQESSNRAIEILKEHPNSVHTLMIHQTPDGLGNPMIPTDTNPKDELYEPFDHVFCGHIHIHKRITEKFTLIGNPIHRDLADAGHKKGFLVKNLVCRENKIKFVQLKGYPEFLKVFEGEEPEDSKGNYIVTEVNPNNVEILEAGYVADFDTSKGEIELVTSYWKAVDGKDEKLLSTGLSFLGISDED